MSQSAIKLRQTRAAALGYAKDQSAIVPTTMYRHFWRLMLDDAYFAKVTICASLPFVQDAAKVSSPPCVAAPRQCRRRPACCWQLRSSRSLMNDAHSETPQSRFGSPDEAVARHSRILLMTLSWQQLVRTKCSCEGSSPILHAFLLCLRFGEGLSYCNLYTFM